MIVGGILVWSGAAHLANPYYFLSTVYQYELTSAPVGALVASYLPFLELVLAACLLSGCCQRAAWSLTSLMLLGFVPGAQVEFSNSAPGGDPRVFRVEGTEVAMRRETAEQIDLHRAE